ncbi:MULTISPECIES: hypothetical protein [unclassified Mameliella]|uniref:hypothetical protein n=1 Tax=unclassified Mameliella TaxID=2630630 RepID=UPI00273E8BD5|nr:MULTISPECIES: hypothetical protein [unclassified Mameliella]
MKSATMGMIAAILTLLIFAALSLPAEAQTLRHCAPRAAVIERLAAMYGETRQAIGLGANGAIMEVFASDGTGTWTITVTMPNGISCLVASGDTFEAINADPAPEGDAL